MTDRSSAVALSIIRADKYRVSVPKGAIAGEYTPEEMRRVARTLIKAADVASDPLGTAMIYGSPTRDFFVFPPLDKSFLKDEV